MSPGNSTRAPGAIVVGAGVAGLTAACTLARGGVRTTLLESCGEPGGLCRTIHHGVLSWSLATYSLRGGTPGGPLAGVLEQLGIAEKVPLRHRLRAYRVLLGADEFPFGTSDEEMLGAAARFGAGGEAALRRLLERLRNFDPVRDYRTLQRATFAAAIADIPLPPRLRAALGAPLMISIGLPPERASAFFSFMKYRLIIEGGLSWPEGGAETLIGALVARFLEDGGDLRFGERVVGVRIDASGKKTVTCDSGERFCANQLVLACDATTALGWLAPQLDQRFLGKAKRLKPTLPVALLLLAGPPTALVRTGLDTFPHLVLVADEDLQGIYARLRRRDASALGMITGLSSPGTWGAPVTTDRLPLTGFFPAPAGARQVDAEELAARLRAALGATGADLALVSAVGPEALRVMALNRGGAFCGWEMGPERYGPARIPPALPIPGIWLAGHWTDPGPSVLNAMLSGRTAARRILDLSSGPF